MAAPFQTIALFGKYNDPATGHVVNDLAGHLKATGRHVLLEDATAAHLEAPAAGAASREAIGRRADLAIVVGGDGTMLNVARDLAPFKVPLLGINLGRLGFLTDIPAERMTEALEAILAGEYEQESRGMLQAEIMRAGRIVHSARALNDVIVSKAELARLIEFELYLDGEFLNSLRADGVIVATPTGSTAYALSAGGPILHPTLAATVIVPICPHTLSDRPIVIGNDSVVEVLMTGTGAQVTFDGQASQPLEDNDRIYVRKGEPPLVLIHPRGRNHFEVLRAKLRWGEKL